MATPDINFLSASLLASQRTAKATHAATFEQVCDYVWSKYRAASDPQVIVPEDVYGLGETIYQELIASGVTTATGGVSYWLNIIWDTTQFAPENDSEINFYKSSITTYQDLALLVADFIAFGRCPNLTVIQFPALQSINQYFQAAYCDALTTIDIGSASASVEVNGRFPNAFEAYYNRRLTSLNILNLTKTGGLHIAFNTFLTSLNVPNLAVVDFIGDGGFSLDLGPVMVSGPTIAIEGNKLSALSLPALSQSGATHSVNLAVRNETSLLSISAPLIPSLKTVLFEYLPACASIDLSGCTSLTSDFDVRVCPLLVGVNALNISNVTSMSGTLTLLDSFFGSILNLNTTLVINGFLVVTNTGLIAVNGMKQCNGMMIRNNASLIAVPSAHVQVIGLSETTVSEITNNAHLTHITFSALTDIKSSMTIAENPIMSYLRAPALTYAGGLLYIHDNVLLNEITLSALVYINTNYFGRTTLASGGLTIQNCPALAILDLSSLVTVAGDIRINACTSLTTVDLSSFVPTNGQTMNFIYNVFSAATINAILARCVANAAFVSGTVDFRVAAHAPIGQGLIDKATLIARGVNVYTI